MNRAKPDDTENALTVSPITRGTSAAMRMDAPKPGTYWRARMEVPETYNHRMDTPFISEATVLMLSRIEHADGAPHVYHFAAHPEWPRDTEVRFHADDFYVWWEPAPDGEDVRQREILQLLRAMDETKALMLQPPPDSAPAGLLTHDPSESVGTPGQALATKGQVRDLERYAARLREDAEKRSTWIQTHSEALGTQGQVLANFHQERAQAALARASTQLEGVESILKTVGNLRLYTGKGVDVLPLRSGAAAPPGTPITIYQDVLAMDEETLAILDQGGLDHTTTEELISALQDPALVQRLIPSDRGIVLVRFRNNYKEFISEKGVRDSRQLQAIARHNAQETERSRQNRLLVRDGERLWLIEAPEVFDGIKQLMPSTGEQDGYFRRDAGWGRPPERITKDDLEYARAQRRQVGVLDRYGQVLIILWGLHDRTTLFENADIPRFSNWLDPGFQVRYLKLISHDTLIGAERPTFGEWQRDQNAYLVAGSQVVVDLRQMFDEDTAPGAYARPSMYSRSHRPDQIYVPAIGKECEGILIARARVTPEGFVVDVPCKYAGYRDVKRASRNITLRLAAEYGKGAYLVLDRVRTSDLNYYLQSRAQRRQYDKYIALFRQARTVVSERDAREQPVRLALRAAVIESGLKHDPDALDEQITDALAVVRSSRQNKNSPLPTDPGYSAYLRSALDALHASVSDNRGRICAIESWCTDHDRTPLRLVVDGKETWRVYLAAEAADHDPRMGPATHAVVGAVRFSGSTGSTTAEVSIIDRRRLRAIAREQVIHDWTQAADWLKRSSPTSLSYAAAIAVLDSAVPQSASYLDLDLDDLVLHAQRWMRDASRRYVRRLHVGFAVGTALYRDRTPALLVARCDALCLAYSRGNEAIKKRSQESIRNIYANKKEERVAELAKPLKWGLVAVELATAAKEADAPYRVDPVGDRVAEDDCADPQVIPTKGADPRRFRITSLTPLGASLLPGFARLTERGT